MKLAFCLFKFFPYGGLQRDFLRIAEECVRRGHSIDIYTMQWEGEMPKNMQVNILPAKGWQNHTRIKNFVDQVQGILAAQSYDCVIGFNKMPGLDVYYAADTCYQAKANEQHGAWYHFTPRYRQLVELEKSVFSPASTTQILLISHIQQAMFELYYHTPAERFHLLPPGIAKDRIAPANAAEIRTNYRHKFNLDDNEFLLLFVGSGFKTKGLDRVLLGLASLPDDLKKRTKLFVVGKDDPESYIKQAKKLNVLSHVSFLGGRDDVPQLMLAGDLLVHPAYNENTGTVLIEALVSGLPVLTTDVCGYAGYVRVATAGQVLLSPFQQTQFNDALQTMLLSPNRKTWQQNGIRFAQREDIYHLVERAVDFIESYQK